jgi:DNA-binding HxlR family transcriptional regulator
MMNYGQFCPIAKAAEIVAERWTPLVLHELLAGSSRFNGKRPPTASRCYAASL